jgi:hypothetical protein
MKEILISLLKIILRTGFAYGLCLLFTTNINPLEWRTIAKVWFVVIAFLFLQQD